MDTSAMMDMVLRLINSVEPASVRLEVLNVSRHYQHLKHLLRHLFDSRHLFAVAERREADSEAH